MGNYASKGDSYSKGESDDLFQPKGDYATTVDFENKIKSFPTIDNIYTKTESDTKFQPKGNYSLLGDSYTKSESDTKFQLKGDYATTVDFENKIKSFPTIDNIYTKTESDTKFQPKGNYSLLGDSYTKSESDAAIKAGNDGLAQRYTKTESDTKFQPKGNYALVGASYTKAEDDTKYATFATKTDLQTSLNIAASSATNTFQPKGNYALVGASYTKAEDDTKYATFATKTDLQTSLNIAASSATNTFQPKGNYALVGASYTKTESDGLYPTKATFDASIKAGNDGLAARYTKAEVDTKVTSLVNNNTLLDIKPKTMWCADGDFCQVPAGKKGFTNGAMIIDNNTIKNDRAGEAGRVHVYGGERLYLLNKDGVIVGREWGGNGNLQVQGNINVSGRDLLAELDDLRSNVVRKDRNYEIVSQNGKCLDAGSNNQGCEFTNDWRRFQFKQIQGVGPELANPKY